MLKQICHGLIATMALSPFVAAHGNDEASQGENGETDWATRHMQGELKSQAL
jgi:hypothetical protein